MTKIETRLSVGDECWTLSEDGLVEGVIGYITINIFEGREGVQLEESYIVNAGDKKFSTKAVFPTKKALLDSL